MDLRTTRILALIALGSAGLGSGLGAGCECVEIHPAAISASSEIPRAVAAARIATLRGAVDIANRFIESPWNRSFPRLRIELRDRGLELVGGEGSRPYRIHCTSWGDLVLGAGGAAQALEGGFVVGELDPCRSRICDNSLFLRSDGSERDASSVARTILHEAAHTLHRRGTIGFWRGTLYFLEAVFLLRSRTHSAERRPRAVTEELMFFEMASKGSIWAGELFEEHLRMAPSACEHGPYDET